MEYKNDTFYNDNDEEVKAVKDFFTKSHNFTGVYCDKQGTIYHYKDGLFHNENGPSIILDNGNKHWYVKGIQHREDGPAIVYTDDREDEYYFKGNKLYLKDLKKMFK